MKRLCSVLAFVLLLAFCAAIARSSVAVERVLRIVDGQLIDLDQMLSESRSAQYIFVAENHEDVRHHAAQLAIIKELHRRGRPLAIGLEMFTSGSQDKLNQWVAGKLPLPEFMEVYARNWTLPWPLYREILLYARDNRIPLIGLNLPQEISHKVARQGFAALTPGERRQLPGGITCNVGPAYMAFIRQAYASHGLQEKEFTHFCEAQMLWNRNMAFQLETFLTSNPRYTVVALVGVGHALRKGVPDEVTREADRYRVVLPEFTGLNRNNVTKQDADYLLLTTSTPND